MRNKVIKIFALAMLFVFCVASTAYAGNPAANHQGKNSDEKRYVFLGKKAGKTKVENSTREDDEDENGNDGNDDKKNEEKGQHKAPIQKGPKFKKPKTEVRVIEVTLNKTSTSIAVGSWERLQASVKPNNAANKRIFWTSSDSSVASVNPSGKVTGIRAGTAVISVAAIDGLKTASCTVTVTEGETQISVTGISLNKTSTTIAVGSHETLTATVTPSDATDKTVYWFSGKPNVASVDRNGLVKGKSAGITEIYAVTRAGFKYDSCLVTVTSSAINVSGVSLNKNVLSLSAGHSERLTATISPGNAANKAVTWSSNNTGVAVVDQNGYVTAMKHGTATITVRTVDGGKTDECTVNVSQNSIAVTGVNLDRTSLSIAAGSTDRLVATVTPADATDQAVTWSSGDSRVVIVDRAGNVGAIREGVATITVKTEDGGKTASCTVTVTASVITTHVTSVFITKTTSISVQTGATKRLAVTVLPESATNKAVIWGSSNSAIASVDQWGNVTGVAEGVATITATTVDGDKADSCTVQVIPHSKWVSVTGVSLNLVSTTLPVGFSERLTYRTGPSNASDQEVRWTSGNPAVASVNIWGDIAAKTTGTAVITVTTVDGSKTAACYVTVMPAVAQPTQGILLNKIASTMVVGATEYPHVTVYPTDTPIPSLTWTSSNTAVASVGSTGQVTGVAVGTAVITVKTPDNQTASYIVMVLPRNG